MMITITIKITISFFRCDKLCFDDNSNNNNSNNTNKGNQNDDNNNKDNHNFLDQM